MNISLGDIAAIIFQMIIACVFSELAAFQYFYFAFAAYVGMVGSLGCHAKKNGLTAIDRNVIVFGFLPIFFLASFLSLQIWKLQYPAWLFR